MTGRKKPSPQQGFGEKGAEVLNLNIGDSIKHLTLVLLRGVVKIATFAKPQNVGDHPTIHPTNIKH